MVSDWSNDDDTISRFSKCAKIITIATGLIAVAVGLPHLATIAFGGSLGISAMNLIKNLSEVAT